MDQQTQVKKITLGEEVDPKTLLPLNNKSSIQPEVKHKGIILGEEVDPETLKPISGESTPLQKKEILPEHITEINAIPDDTEKINRIDDQIENILKEKKTTWDKYKDESPSDALYPSVSNLFPSSYSQQKDLLDQKLDSLKTLRSDLKNGMSFLQDPKIVEAVVNSTRFTRDSTGALNNHYLDNVSKVGLPVFNKIDRLTYDYALDNLNTERQKKSERDNDTESLYNFHTIKNNKLNVTPEEESELEDFLKTSNKEYESEIKDSKNNNYAFRRKFINDKLKIFIDKKLEDPNEKKEKLLDYTKAVNSLMFLNPDNGKSSMYGIKIFTEDINNQVRTRLNEISDIRDQINSASTVLNADGSDPLGQLIGYDERNKLNFDAYKQRIEDQYKSLKKTYDLTTSILDAKEARSGIRDTSPEDIKTDDFRKNILTELEVNLGIQDIKNKINGTEGRYEPTWEDAIRMQYYNGIANDDFGYANSNLQQLKSINWEDKNGFQKFGVGAKAGSIGMISGMEKLASEGFKGLYELTNSEDMFKASQKLSDVALETYKDRQKIYGEGVFHTMGTFAPLLAGTIAAVAVAPAGGGSSLALIPSIIGNTVLTGMVADVAGNSLIEQDEYNKENGIKDDPAKKYGIVVGQAVAMILTGKVLGGSSKLLTNTVGKAVGISLQSSDKLSRNLMENYIRENPQSWQKLTKNFVLNSVKEGGKNAGTMGLMTAANDFLADLAKNPVDQRKFEQIVVDSWRSAKAGALFGLMIGPAISAQSGIYRHLRQKENGLDIVQTKDGNIYERVGSDPDNVNRVVVIDKNLNATKIDRKDIVDWFSMTTKEKNQYLDAYKNNKTAIPKIEADIRANAIRRQVTKMISSLLPKGKTASGTSSEKANITIYNVDEKTYYVKGKTADGKIELITFEPQGDGSFKQKSAIVDNINVNNTITMPAGEYINMTVDYYTNVIPAEGEPIVNEKPPESSYKTRTSGSPEKNKQKFTREDITGETVEKETVTSRKPIIKEEDIINNENARIRNKYNLLSNNDLLNVVDGKVQEPTLEYFMDMKSIIEDDVAGINEKLNDPFSDIPLEEENKLREELQNKTVQLDIINGHLDEFTDTLGTEWDNKLPKEKNDILESELKKPGAVITGKVDLQNQFEMLVTTDDGRIVNGIINVLPGESQDAFSKRKNKIEKEIKKGNNKVSLKLVRNQDWNPEGKIKTTEVHPMTGEIEEHPYINKIDIMLGDEPIGIVEQNDYNEKRNRAARLEKAKNTIKDGFEAIVNRIAKNTGAKASLLASDELSIRKAVEKIVNGFAEVTHLKAKDILDFVKKKVGDLGYSQEEVAYANNVITKYETNIQRSVEQKQLAEKLAGKFDVKKLKPFKIPEEIIIESINGPVASAAQKVDLQLKAFFPMWRTIATETGKTRDHVQNEYWHMINDPKNGFNTVTNEETYQAWLLSRRNGDSVRERIIDYMQNIPLGTAVSISNFYGNVTPTMMIGEVVTKDGKMTNEILNPSNSYDEFVSDFDRHLNAKKAETIKNIATRHKFETNQRFLHYRQLSSEKKIEAKEEQWKQDLIFLEQITNVPSEIWRQYFVEQTKETYSFPNPFPIIGRDSKVNYRTYQNLIEHETYRPGGPNKDVPYVWQQGDIVWQLLNKKEYNPDNKTSNEFFNIVREYFLVGNDASNVMSNLYKLTTALKDKNNIGASGRSVNGSRLSSFIQDSALSKIAKNILSSKLGNNVRLYQGHVKNSPDSRRFNYWTLNKREALNYTTDNLNKYTPENEKPENVRSINVNLDNFIRKYSPEFNELIKEFNSSYEYKGELKFFDILDSSPEGLQNQEEFFRFLKSKGYDGYTELIEQGRLQGENQYVVTFNPIESYTSKFGQNHLVDYYKSLGKPMDIVIIDGLHNRAIAKSRKGNTSDEMSGEDLWITMLSQFGIGEKSFLHIIGQFADKSYIKVIDAPSYKNISDQYLSEVIDLLEGKENYDDLFHYIKYEVIALSQSVFKEFISEPHKQDFSEYDKFIQEFIVSYVLNTDDAQHLFFGNITDKLFPKGYIDITKRGGTFVTTGYTPNENIEGGVGHSFRHVVAYDQKLPLFGIKESTDGEIFMLGDYAKKMQVSTGSVYSKISEYELLHSLKAAIVGVDPETNDAFLIKANWINIEIAAEKNGGRHKDIRDFMVKYKIDIFSTLSSTKVHSGSTIIDLFDENGDVRKDVVVAKEHICNRPTSSIIVQQNLISTTNPRQANQASQFQTNIFIVKNAKFIIDLVAGLKKTGLDDLMSKLSKNSQAGYNFIKENVSDFTQGDLKELLDAGLTSDDPAYRTLMHQIKSTAIGRNALDLHINRVISQEVADIDGDLKVLRKTKDEKHVLLPEINAGIKGARSKKIFKGTIEDAENHIINNPFKYHDLFDRYANVMTYALEPGKEKGTIEIPGEAVLDSRIPFDGLHSLTVARLNINYEDVNWGMRDRESQIIAGLDFDGDSGYIQVFAKKNGKVILDDSKEGVMNDIMTLVIEAYSDPDTYDFIRRPIDTDAYNDIVDRVRGGSKYKLNRVNPKSLVKVRTDNLVGNKMKGILTNHLTVHALLSRYNIPLKKALSISFNSYKGPQTFRLNKIAKDKYGAIQVHLSNFTNMSFDNSKNPRIETLGDNEVTANMYTYMLITNESLSSDNFSNYEDHWKAVYDAIDNITDYFNGPVFKQYIHYIRRAKGGMRNETNAAIKDRLLREAGRWIEDIDEEVSPGAFTPDDVYSMYKLFYAASELSDINILYGLTQDPPITYLDYIKAKQVIRKVKFMKSEKQCEKEGIPFMGMQYIDTKSLFVYDKDTKRMEFIPELRIVGDVIKAAQDNIFNDMIEESIPGKKIIAYIFNLLKSKNAKLKELDKNDLAVITGALNKIFNLRALKENRSNSEVSKELFELLKPLKDKYPENDFLNYIRFVDTVKETHSSSKKTRKISINPESRTSILTNDPLRKSIRQSFDSLPENIKDLFAAYTVYTYGANNSTLNGGFYSLLGIEFRVELSKLMSNEKDRWLNDELTPLEIYNTALWVQKSMIHEGIREADESITYSSNIDFNIDPKLKGNIPINVVNEIDAIDTSAGENISQTEHERILSDANLLSQRGILTIPAIREYKKNQLEKANKLFGPKPEDKPIRNLFPGDNSAELLFTEDAGLQDRIFAHLQMMYPDLQVFKDRDAFAAYIQKNTDRLITLNIEAIGHAFGNSIYINPDSPIQERGFHEMGHIYWDYLPEDHHTKVDLRKLYREDPENKDLDDEKLDEKIIIDIGQIGTDKNTVFINPSLFDRFINFLKEFWKAVKAMFGKYSKKDLLDDLVSDIYTNRDNINLETIDGTADIRNLVKYDNRSVATIGKDILISTESALKGVQDYRFNPLERVEQEMKRFISDYRRKNKVDPPSSMVDRHIAEYKIKYDEPGNIREAIDASIENVFSGKNLSPDVLKNFSDKSIADEFARQLNDMKNEILQKYPNVRFYSNDEIVSMKYKTFSKANLIADIGNNKLIIMSFETIETAIKDKLGNKSKDYVQAYGIMKNPLERVIQSKLSDHTLKLSMQANILTEQNNSLNPGEKNTIEGLYVIPVEQRINENGLIEDMRISNAVEVPGTDISYVMPFIDDKYYNAMKLSHEVLMANNITNYLAQRTAHVNNLFPQLEIDMKKDGFLSITITEVKKALLFFITESNIPISTNITRVQDLLKDIDAKTISSINYTGIRKRYSSLLEKGFSPQETREIPAEAYLNIYHLGITKERWSMEEKALYNEQEVGTRMITIPNPNIPESMKYQRYYHINIEGKDIYSHEAGTSTVKNGDKIVQIIEVQSAITKQRTYNILTVEEVNSKFKQVIAVDKSGKRVKINGVTAREGILIYDESGHVPGRNTTPNNYIPRHITYEEPIIVKAWAHDTNMSKENKASKKDLRSFYEKYKTVEDLRNLADNFDELVGIYNGFHTNGITNHLIDFLRESIVNHTMAYHIRQEVKFANSGMPMTTNIYHLLTEKSKSLLPLPYGAKGLLPPAWLNSGRTELNSLIMNIGAEIVQKTEATMIFKREFDRLMNDSDNKLDLDNMKRTSGGKMFWISPSNKSLTVSESKMLTLIEDAYRKYDKRYIGNTKPIEIEVGPASVDEFRSEQMFGKEWGNILYQLLRKTRYDHILVDIAEWKDGRWIKTGKQDTFFNIKQKFAETTFDQQAIDEYLGPHNEFKYLDIPFVRKAGPKYRPITPGKLAYYDRQAQDKYNSNVLNRKQISSKNRVQAMIVGSNLYKTKNILLSTGKSIASKIEAYHLERTIAFNDYLSSLLIQDPRHKEYIEPWLDVNVYKEREDDDPEMRLLFNSITRGTSYAHILFSVASPILNITGGTAVSTISEPFIFARGVKRIIQNPRKYLNILKNQNLVNITNDLRFDEVDKQTGVVSEFMKKFLGINIPSFGQAKIIEWGYKFTDWAEKFNQYPTFIGEMTDTETNAYNNDGHIIDPSKNEHMSPERIMQLTSGVQRLQGPYDKFAGAPTWLSYEGNMTTQFKKYLIAMWNLANSPVRIDRFNRLDQGMIQSMAIIGKLFKFNFLDSEQKKVGRIIRILTESRPDYEKAEAYGVEASILDAMELREPLHKDDRPYTIEDINDLVDIIISARNDGRIELNDVPQKVKRQFAAALTSLALLFGSLTILAIRKSGGKDEKKWKMVSEDRLIKMLSRFNSDMFQYANPQSIMNMIQRPVPAIDFVTGLFKFMYHFTQWSSSVVVDFADNAYNKNFEYAFRNFFYPSKGVYTTTPLENPGQYIPQGWPLFVKDSFSFIKASGGIKTVFSAINYYNDHKKVIATLEKNGASPLEIREAKKYLTSSTTFKELREGSIKGKAEQAMYVKSETYKKYKKNGMAGSVSDIEAWQNEVEQSINNMNYYEFHQKVVSGRINRIKINDEMKENAEKYDEQIGKGNAKPASLKYENYKEADKERKERRYLQEISSDTLRQFKTGK